MDMNLDEDACCGGTDVAQRYEPYQALDAGMVGIARQRPAGANIGGHAGGPSVGVDDRSGEGLGQVAACSARPPTVARPVAAS